MVPPWNSYYFQVLNNLVTVIQVITYRFSIATGLFILNSVALGSSKIATSEAFLPTLGVGEIFLAAFVYFGKSWIKNFGNDASNTTKTRYFIVTPKLIEVARVLIGSSLSLKTIEAINKGTIDLLSGIVLVTSFSKDIEGFRKFEIQTQSGNIFTFVNDKNVLDKDNVIKVLDKFIADVNAVRFAIQDFFSPENRALTVVGNLDLLNRSKIIAIRNLELHEKEIIEAFNFGQPISCIYDRVGKSIYALQIQSKVTKKLVLNSKSQAQQVNQSSVVF